MNDDLENVNLTALTQAAMSNRKMVLVIRASDGETVQIFGGPILPGEDPAVGAKGHWYRKDNCVYVFFDNKWLKACAPNPMVLVIQASDGALIAVNGNVSEAENPNVSPKDSWYWTHNSPGCVYYKHNGVWKKVCN